MENNYLSYLPDIDWTFSVLAETQSMAYFFGAFLLFSLFVFITSRVNFWIRFVGIPLILVLSIWGYSELDKILGYAYPGDFPKEVQYLAYTIEPKEKEKGQWIILWVRETDGKTRLYRIEYSEKKEQQLKKAKKGQKKGKQYKLLKPPRNKKGNVKYERDTFELHEISHWNYPDKNQAPQKPQEIPR